MEQEAPPDLQVSLSIEEILTRVGEFGRFQKIVDGIFCFTYLFVSYQIFIMYFATLTPSWKCVNNSTECTFNGTLMGEDTRRCDVPRDQWYYTKQKHFSLVTEFDIHCSQIWLISLVNSVHFIGWGVGGFILGYAGDRYGRKTLLLPSTAAVLTSGFVVIFLPNIHYIILCRFLVGFFIPGSVVQASILISEIVGCKHRPLAVLIPFFCFPIGYSLLALKAYFLQDWKILTVVCSVPYVVLLVLYPFLPESVKWMEINNRLDDAMNVFRSIAKWNNKDLESKIALASSHVTTASMSNAREASTNAKLILFTFIQCFIWTASAMTFFGLQLAAKELEGPMYSNFALLSMVAFPATIVSIIILKKFGRKKTSLISLLLAGAACLVIAIIPSKSNFVIIRVIFGVVGKFSASIAIQGLYVWATEIFPTKLRSKCMGFVQAAGRIGATSTPWIVKGLTPIAPSLPFIVLGIPSLLGFVLGMWLPETYAEKEKKKGSGVETGIDNEGNNIEMDIHV